MGIFDTPWYNMLRRDKHVIPQSDTLNSREENTLEQELKSLNKIVTVRRQYNTVTNKYDGPIEGRRLGWLYTIARVVISPAKKLLRIVVYPNRGFIGDKHILDRNGDPLSDGDGCRDGYYLNNGKVKRCTSPDQHSNDWSKSGANDTRFNHGFDVEDD